MMAKAADSLADQVFLDLEDAVAMASKEYARAQAIEALNTLDWSRKTVSVRINDLRTSFAYRDIVEIVEKTGDKLDTIIVPKVLKPSDVTFMDVLLTQIELATGRRKSIGLEILVEEAAGLARVEKIAVASNRIETLIFGMGDYSASQGMPINWVTGKKDYPGDVWHFARFKIAMAAHSAGIVAIDGPFSSFADKEGYLMEARLARSLGFAGKWAIHPNQIDWALQAFNPNPDEIALARKLLAAFDAAQLQGNGAISVGDFMVDIGSARLLKAWTAKADAFFDLPGA